MRTARLAPLAAALALVIGVTSVGAPSTLAATPPFHLAAVSDGFLSPTYVTSNGNPLRLFVVEQRGVIKVLKRSAIDQPWQKAGVFLDMRSRVLGPFVGRGLLGLAFDKNYAKTGRFYVFYTRQPDGYVAIAEYRRSTSLRANAGSWRQVVVVPYTASYHFGGWIGFGPDGSMYATTGDGTQPATAQDLNNRQGKVLRFNAHKAEGQAGFVPPDNPYVGIDGDDLVWASGLRNPWRASFDAATDSLWLPDVGQSSYEEVNRFSPVTTGTGANVGWPMCEGAHAYPVDAANPQPCTAQGVVEPLIEYPHANGDCSIIGGYVYRGSAQPALAGRYFYGDYCTGDVWNVRADYSAGAIDPPLTTGLHIDSFGTDSLGELYVVAHDGTLWRVVQD